MRDLAYIAKIEKLSPIAEADRIELASIAGWNVIVEKGKYKEGDLCVYAEYDTILPSGNEHFEFLRKRCYSKLYDGFRIKSLKMKGVLSQGIIFPLNILPESFKVKEGAVVAEVLGIQRYDPEAKRELEEVKKKRNPVLKFFMKNKLFRKVWMKTHTKPKGGYPDTVQKSDETNIQKLFNEYKERYNDTKFYVSEKCEGQAGSWMLQKNRYRFFSHNVEVTKSGNTNWRKISVKYNLENKLRQYKKKHGVELAIQGEIVGPGIQRNIYGLDELKLFVYKITDTKTGEAFNFVELRSICEELDLEMVPYLGIDTIERLNSIDEILAYSNGTSVLNSKVMREGIVWRSVHNQSIGFKAKSPEYLAWFSKKDTTE